MIFFKYKRIQLGNLVAKQFIVFEHKKLFGVIFYYFSGGKQDRFHTHAFNSLSIKIFGKYMEGILDNGVIKYIERNSIFKYFNRNEYHSINDSKGCLTLLIQGPWKKTWKEYRNGIERTLTWHRKVV